MESSAFKEQLKVRRKPEAVRDWLETLSHRLGPGARLPRAAQLCQELGISANTLDRALRELESCGVIHRRHGVGIFVAQSTEVRVRRVLLICHPMFFTSATHSPFWDLLMGSLREQAAAGGYAFEYHFAFPENSGPGLHENLIEDIRAGRVHGVLGIGLSNEAAYFLEEHVAYVSFAGWSNYMVGLNWKMSARLAVGALKDAGCSRVGAWLGIPTGRSYHPRLVHVRERVAFRGALRRAGLEFDAHLWRDGRDVLTSRRNALSQQEQGYEMARKIWKTRANRPDGVMFFDDMLARGALTALTGMGVKIGKDVQIATHANTNSDVLLGHENGVIRVEIAPSELVGLMFRQLEALMHQQEVPRVTVYAQPQLVQPETRVSL